MKKSVRLKESRNCCQILPWEWLQNLIQDHFGKPPVAYNNNKTINNDDCIHFDVPSERLNSARGQLPIIERWLRHDFTGFYKIERIGNRHCSAQRCVIAFFSEVFYLIRNRINEHSNRSCFENLEWTWIIINIWIHTKILLPNEYPTAKIGASGYSFRMWLQTCRRSPV